MKEHVFGGSVPQGLQQIRPCVWAVQMPISHGSMSTTALLVGSRDELHVVDPGSDTPGNRKRMADAMAALGCTRKNVASITVTHLHSDHFGLARWVSAPNSLPVQMHEQDAENLHDGSSAARYLPDPAPFKTRYGVPESHFERLQTSSENLAGGTLPQLNAIAHGGRLEVSHTAVDVIHTPGHTRGHICLTFPELELIATGDHVLPDQVAGLGIGGDGTPDDPINDYLQSLDALAPYDGFEVVPGHGEVFRGLEQRRASCLAYVHRRIADAEAAFSYDASVWEVASRLRWGGGGWDAMTGMRLRSALRQTELYMAHIVAARGRVSECETIGR